MTDRKKGTEKTKKDAARQEKSCQSCVWFDYDELYGEEVCRADLDEDEMGDFLSGRTSGCPMYRFYDEYVSVRRQN